MKAVEFTSTGRIVTTDNGDSTGTRTTYDLEGEVVGVEQLTGLPIPLDPTPDPTIVAAEEALALMVLCIAAGDDTGAQQAAQMWAAAVGLA